MNPSENALSGQTTPQIVEHTVVIDAPPKRVWEALTNIEQMLGWMAEPEMQIEILTDWRVGGPMVVKGFHHVQFESNGRVFEFDPPNVLRYSHLSSVSQLPDVLENHSILEFRLIPTPTPTPTNEQTTLTLKLSVFPTDSIFRHLDFYWRVTLGILKQFVEASR